MTCNSPPRATAESTSPAPNGRRFLAHVIDLAALVVLSFPLMLAWTVAELNAFPGTPSWGQRAIDVIIAFLYYLPSWRLAGASPGKRLLGLRLIGPDGGRPGLARAFVRCAVMLVLSIPFGLTWWPVLARPDRRAIHDLAAGTRVILAPRDP